MHTLRFALSIIAFIVSIQVFATQTVDPEKIRALTAKLIAEGEHLAAFRKEPTAETFAKIPLEQQQFYMGIYLLHPDRAPYLENKDGSMMTRAQGEKLFGPVLNALSPTEKADVYAHFLTINLDQNPQDPLSASVTIDGKTYKTYGELREFLAEKSNVSQPERMQKFVCESLLKNFYSPVMGFPMNLKLEYVATQLQKLASLDKVMKKTEGQISDTCITDQYSDVNVFSISHTLLMARTDITQFMNLHSVKNPKGQLAFATSKTGAIYYDSACTRQEVENYITTYTDYVNENKNVKTYGFGIGEGQCRLTLKLHRKDNKWFLEDFLNPSKTVADNKVPFSSKEELIDMIMAHQKNRQKPNLTNTGTSGSPSAPAARPGAVPASAPSRK